MASVLRKLRGKSSPKGRDAETGSLGGLDAGSLPVVESSLYERRDSTTSMVHASGGDSKAGKDGSSGSKASQVRSPGGTRLVPRNLATLAGTPLVLVMVGLPARGKSYITQKLVRYLCWRGFTCREFNAGSKRRDLMDGGGQSANFFQGESSARENIAKLTFDDLVEWLKDGGHVAVFDATNTTCNRRAKVIEWCKAAELPAPIFVESICDDEEILDVNYRLKLRNKDYAGMEPKAALADFLQRVKEYEAVYEPVGSGNEGDAVSYLKLFNVGQKVVINRCYGFLVSQIVTCLQNFHINNRRIFICRHGESEDNQAGRIGGDSPLTAAGDEFAQRLCDLMLRLRGDERRHADDLADNFSDDSRDRLMVASSMLRRAQQTAAPLRAVGDERIHFLATNQLNEISAGKFEGWTYAEIQQKHPEEFKSRQQRKLLYRYPMGESYVDVINRLNPLVQDVERLRYDVLVVCHQACARALLGYFLGTPANEVPYLEVPLHTVLEISPGAFKCKVTEHKLL